MKRANIIVMISAGISLFVLVPVLFSQETTAGKNSQQKQIASEASLNIETPQAPKDRVDIKSDVVERSIPSYRMRLKNILKEAEENIKKVNKELSEQEIMARNQEREAKVAQAFESGNQLYKEGKLKEAKEEWNRALSISKDPEMRGYVEEVARKASEEDRRVKEEDGRRQEEAGKEQERLDAEARKKARAERDRLEAERIESGKNAREEARKLEAEQREKSRLEKEATRKLEAEQREKARLEREAARKLKTEQRDKARLEKEPA